MNKGVIDFISWIDGGVERVSNFATGSFAFENVGDNQAKVIAGASGNYLVGKNNQTRVMQTSILILANTDYDKYLQNIVNLQYTSYTEPQVRRVFIDASSRKVSFDIINVSASSFEISHDNVANENGGIKTYQIECVPVSGFNF